MKKITTSALLVLAIIPAAHAQVYDAGRFGDQSGSHGESHFFLLAGGLFAGLFFLFFAGFVLEGLKGLPKKGGLAGFIVSLVPISLTLILWRHFEWGFIASTFTTLAIICVPALLYVLIKTGAKPPK